MSTINVTDHILYVTRHAAGLPDTVSSPASTSELLINLSAAKEYATQCKTNHVELRDAYLNGLAEAIISKRCPILDTPKFLHEKAEKVAHEIRELIKRE